MKRVLAVLIAITATLLGASVARADTSGTSPTFPFPNVLHLNSDGQHRMQARVDEALASRDGGVQISQYEVAWPDQGAVLALTPPGARVAPPASAQALRHDSKAVNLRAGVDPSIASSTDVVTPMGSSASCPWTWGGTYWYCFYVDKDFNGDRFQFSYRYCNGSYVNLNDWNRSNQASSWVNNTNFTIDVYDFTNATGWLWTEGRVSNNSWVGSVANDRASSFTAC